MTNPIESRTFVTAAASAALLLLLTACAPEPGGETVQESSATAAQERAPGDTFDPAQHEAVHFQPSGDQAPGSVLSTFRPGYRTQDRVLRPAQVVVAAELVEQ